MRPIVGGASGALAWLTRRKRLGRIPVVVITAREMCALTDSCTGSMGAQGVWLTALLPFAD